MTVPDKAYDSGRALFHAGSRHNRSLPSLLIGILRPFFSKVWRRGGSADGVRGMVRRDHDTAMAMMSAKLAERLCFFGLATPRCVL
jgi:hypothetical protein